MDMTRRGSDTRTDGRARPKTNAFLPTAEG